MNNNVVFSPPRGGFDLPLVGLDTGLFYYIHIPALACIFLSLCSVVAVLVTSFRHKNVRKFCSWNKSERFVIYIAICDGLLNISHSLDHMQILITKNHVYPVELCEFYAFVVIEFASAQILMVNLIAINAFMFLYCGIDITFGRHDCGLLLYIFGVPIVCGTLAASFGGLGSNGVS